MPRQVYEIFLSSTSKDLQKYRDKVRQMIDRLRLTSIRMETFGAKPTKPFDKCRLEVQNCDALIVIVGNRYGWIPSTGKGGDNVKSITWWEVAWAIEANIPVYAFLCDPEVNWEMDREQDRLLWATDEKTFIEIGKAVLHLKYFRTFLEDNTTREIFTSVDDLAAKVATSLHDWILDIAVQKERASHVQEKVIPVSSPSAPPKTEGSKILYDFEQSYWQEQVHLLSANALSLTDDEIGIGLIAGYADLGHPVLVNNRSIRQVDARSNKAAPTVSDDYTTAMAGILVGDSQEAPPYRGILPNAKLTIFQILSSEMTSTNSDMLSALEAAIVEGNRVVCLPLNGLQSSKEEEIAYERAANMGVIVVCGAGNSSSKTPEFPAGYPSCISVGATDGYNMRAKFSNYGDWVTTFAPGKNIPVAKAHKKFDKWSGTSFSCGIVAGIIGLMLKANKNLTFEQIRKILKTNGPNVYNSSGGPMEWNLKQVDAFQAVQATINGLSKGSN